MVESQESTRQRVESSLLTKHEDRIAGKGFTSMTYYKLVHKFIPMPQAMIILDARAAVDNEWKKLETIPAWILKKVKGKKGLFSKRTDKQIHFATYPTLKGERHVKERSRSAFQWRFTDGETKATDSSEGETRQFGVTQPVEREGKSSAEFGTSGRPGECRWRTG